MKKTSKKILSFVLSFVMILTMGMSGVVTESAKAADSANTVKFSYRYGKEDLIQFNTDLPADTPCVDFTAGENGCELKQDGQSVGWVGMQIPKDESQVVLTFHFNTAFEAGQTYTLKQGSKFGFKNGMLYQLNQNYVLTFNGTQWKMATTYEHITFEKRAYATNDLFQVDTNLPATTPLKSFLASDNGCKLTQEGKCEVGYISMNNDNGTIVLTFNFNETFAEGEIYTIKQGSEFVFTNGLTYLLDKNYTFTCNGDNWDMTTSYADITFEKRAYATNQLFQVNTNLPATTLLKDFLASDNGCKLTQEGKCEVGYISMNNDNGTIVLTFNFNETYEVGETYTLKKGSKFAFTDGFAYTLDKDYIFTYAGNDSWTMANESENKEPQTLTISGVHYGDGNVLMLKSNLPLSLGSLDKATAKNLNEAGSTKASCRVRTMPNGDSTAQLLVIDFDPGYERNENYVLKKGSSITFGDTEYVLDADFTMYYNGKTWKEGTAPLPQTLTISGVHYGDGNVLMLKSNLPTSIGAPNAAEAKNINEEGSAQKSTEIRSLTNKDVQPNEQLLVIDFKPSFEANKSYVLKKGSSVTFNDTDYILENGFIATYHGGTSWTITMDVVVGDTNDDGKVTSIDLVRMKKAQAGTYAYAKCYDIVDDSVINEYDAKCERYILVGADWSTVAQSKEVLLAESKFNGGGEFITFADRPADPTDPEKIKEYKAVGFNTSLVTGEHGRYQQSYVKGTVGEKTYTLAANEKALVLETTGWTNSSLMQVKTNLPENASYGNFGFAEKSEFKCETNSGKAFWFQYEYDANTAAGYLNPVATSTLELGDNVVFKAGSKLQVGSEYYALEADYTVTFSNDYQAAIENLDAEGLNVWIRNTGNNPDYFTESRLALLQPYKDIIDGVYMNDEPFETEALYTYSKEKFNANEVTESFDTLGSTAATLFNENFANKYFHVNHVPITSYNHYGENKNLSAYDATKYNTFFNNYVNNVLNKVETSNEKKTIGFDNYPFGYSSTDQILWWTSEKFNTTGIEPTYLLNLLIPAQVAKKEGNTYSVCIQTYDKITQKNETRVVDTKEEITMQIYTAMACGADMLEYFLYNTLPASANSTAMAGMIAEDGSKRPVYTATMNANKETLPFADVVKTFTWEGAEFFSGSSNKNSEGKNLVNNSSLNLVLSNSNDGALNSASATDDILVGYYTKDGQDAYMLANFNDPKQVTNNNTVTLNFGDCNYARVYTGTANGLTSEIVSLNNGSYTFTLQPGGGCFVIPVNAAS